MKIVFDGKTKKYELTFDIRRKPGQPAKAFFKQKSNFTILEHFRRDNDNKQIRLIIKNNKKKHMPFKFSADDDKERRTYI